MQIEFMPAGVQFVGITYTTAHISEAQDKLLHSVFPGTMYTKMCGSARDLSIFRLKRKIAGH